MIWPFGKKKEEKKEKEEQVEEEQTGEICSVCGKPGADKKFGGMWFHKKCLRKARKKAKSLV